MAAATPTRDEEIRLIWTENQWLYLVTGFLAGVLFCILAGLSVDHLPELIVNMLPEATGILITITVIDFLNRRRDDRNALKQLKEQLIRDASSIVNDVANNAVHQLRKREWLESDTALLSGRDLREANLQNAALRRACLQQANLAQANLQDADLRETNLQQADLGRANLQEVTGNAVCLREANLTLANLQDAKLLIADLQKGILSGAKLQGAYLKEANLQGADLSNANLDEANLTKANLRGTNLTGASLEYTNFGQGEHLAEFDETTILPDGTFWTPEMDMTIFTDVD